MLFAGSKFGAIHDLKTARGCFFNGTEHNQQSGAEGARSTAIPWTAECSIQF